MEICNDGFAGTSAGGCGNDNDAAPLKDSEARLGKTGPRTDSPVPSSVDMGPNRLPMAGMLIGAGAGTGASNVRVDPGAGAATAEDSSD